MLLESQVTLKTIEKIGAKIHLKKKKRLQYAWLLVQWALSHQLVLYIYIF